MIPYDVPVSGMTRRRGRAIVAQYSMGGAEHTYDSKQGGFASMAQSD